MVHGWTYSGGRRLVFYLSNPCCTYDGVKI